jgi:hypothetical protein
MFAVARIPLPAKAGSPLPDKLMDTIHDFLGNAERLYPPYQPVAAL